MLERARARAHCERTPDEERTLRQLSHARTHYHPQGQQLEIGDEICGAGTTDDSVQHRPRSLTRFTSTVASLRAHGNRLHMWCRHAAPAEAINALGRRLLQLFNLSSTHPGIQFEFTPHHVGSKLPGNEFISIKNGMTGQPSIRPRVQPSGSSSRSQLSVQERVGAKMPVRPVYGGAGCDGVWRYGWKGDERERRGGIP